jgi:hypothetical protein
MGKWQEPLATLLGPSLVVAFLVWAFADWFSHPSERPIDPPWGGTPVAVISRIARRPPIEVYCHGTSLIYVAEGAGIWVVTEGCPAVPRVEE